MPIGLLFYTNQGDEYAIEASRIRAFRRQDDDNALLILEDNRHVHTATPYQKLVADYTWLVEQSQNISIGGIDDEPA